MTNTIETMLVSVRADTGAFARDVAQMRGELEGPLATGMDKAGRALEASLNRFLQTGKFGFEDLKKVALSVMAEIARAAMQAGISAMGQSGGGGNGSGFGGGGGGTSSLISAAIQIASAFMGSGAPGRATGGPVTPGRAYMVGERGPELFVPTSSGRVEAGHGGAGRRDIRITINVGNGGGGANPSSERMQATGRQIARAVRAAVAGAE